MGNQGICILLVNEDLTCCNIVAEMLKICNYEVLQYSGKPLETLSTIYARKDRINVVLTNLHRIQAQVTSDILHHIQRTLNLPTFLMSPDGEKNIELKEQEGGFAAYLLTSLNNTTNVSLFLELASVNATKVTKAITIRTRAQMASTAAGSLPGLAENPQESRKRRQKRGRSEEGFSGGADDDHHGYPNYYLQRKRPRVIWNEELHRKFLEAIETIFPDKPVPKKIVEVMNVPGLKRENVASHLQKYRMILKRAEEGTANDDDDSNDIGIMMMMNLQNQENNNTDIGHNQLLSFPAALIRSRLDVNYNCSRQRSCYLTQLPYGSGIMARFNNNNNNIPRSPSPSGLINNSSRASAAAGGNNNNNQGSLLLPLYNSKLTPPPPNQSIQMSNNNKLPLPNSPAGNYHIDHMDPTGFHQRRQLNLHMIVDHDPSGTAAVGSYVGFRLSDDGKRLQFGNKELTREALRVPPFSKNIISGCTCTTTGSDHQNQIRRRRRHEPSSTSTNAIVNNGLNIPPSSTTNLHLQNDDSIADHHHENRHNSDGINNNNNNNSSFFERMSLLVKSLKETLPEIPLPVQEDSMINTTTTVNDDDHGPSSGGLIILPAASGDHHEQQPAAASSLLLPSSTPAPRNALSVVLQCHSTAVVVPLSSIINIDGQPQNNIPLLPPPSGNNAVADHSSSEMLSNSQHQLQESNIVTSAENPGHDASLFQEETFQKDEDQEYSSMPEEQLNSSWLVENFWNETGNPPPWDGNFDPAFF